MKVICCVLSIIILLPVLAFSQLQDRVIDGHPIIIHETFLTEKGGTKMIPSDIKALEILEIKVDGKAVRLGQSFSAGSDWLKSLIVRVKNTSGKPISSIRMNFSLPEAKSKDREGVTMGFTLEYGKALRTDFKNVEQKIILPNEELDLSRTEAQFNRLRISIAQKAGITEFSKVYFASTVVLFEDGTVWHSSWKSQVANQSK